MGHDRHQVETHDEVPDQEDFGVLSPDEMKAGPSSGGEPTRMRTWDGAGNPIEHAIGPDDDGFLSEGTGRTPEDAVKSMKDTSEVIGKDAGPLKMDH